MSLQIPCQDEASILAAIAALNSKLSVIGRKCAKIIAARKTLGVKP